MLSYYAARAHAWLFLVAKAALSLSPFNLHAKEADLFPVGSHITFIRYLESPHHECERRQKCQGTWAVQCMHVCAVCTWLQHPSSHPICAANLQSHIFLFSFAKE